MTKLKKTLLLIIGITSLAMGVIGILIPILPTTPFLLLTSFCFMKGSSRFHNWFQETTIYKKYLADFVARGGMTLKAKIHICAICTFLISIPFFLVDNWIMRIGLMILVAIKYLYFAFGIKTLEPKASWLKK